MEIAEKLRNARMKSGLTQEQVAEQIHVSRQTISNWENGKSYPDILSVIKISDLYVISLDVLLKEDQKMIEYLDESTDIVSSNKRLVIAIAINIVLLFVFIIFSSVLSTNKYLLVGVVSVFLISTATVFYQVIRKF